MFSMAEVGLAEGKDVGAVDGAIEIDGAWDGLDVGD
jgi:hypothetical protein